VACIAGQSGPLQLGEAMAGDAGHLFLNIKLLKKVEMGKEEGGSLTSLTSFD